MIGCRENHFKIKQEVINIQPGKIITVIVEGVYNNNNNFKKAKQV